MSAVMLQTKCKLNNTELFLKLFHIQRARREFADIYNCRVPQPRCLRIRQTPFQPSTMILTVALVFITSLFHGTRWKTKITVIKKCSHENGEIYGKTKRNENLHCPTPG